MNNSPTPLEKAVELDDLRCLEQAESILHMTTFKSRQLEIYRILKQLSTLRQNSVPKSVWDETHAKYLEECEKNLALQNENKGLKETIRQNGLRVYFDDIRPLITERDSLKSIAESTRAENVKMEEGLARLAFVCTCDRPTIILPDGGVKAPGPHTSKCVSTIARQFLSTPPTTDNSKEDVK